MKTPSLSLFPVSTMPVPRSIEAARSAFQKGHTSEDVEAVLGPLSDWLGYKTVVGWSFMDCYGCGGDSELMVVDDRGRFCEAPADLVEFLYEEDNDIDASGLKKDGLSKRGQYRGRKTWEEVEHPHNFTRKVYSGEAPKY
jgi:hypothetical protein